MLTLSLLLSALQWIKPFRHPKAGALRVNLLRMKHLRYLRRNVGLGRQYSQAHDPLVKIRINQFQKEIKDSLRKESQTSWEKFCIHNEVLRLGTTTSLFHHLARLFTSSIQIGYIPTAWKLATLRMLLKPDKLPSLTSSYRLISLTSSIMKLFERVIEQRLRSYLDDIGFIKKYQSGFRHAKSTDDHLFRLSQSVMESFNRREHVVAAFLDIGKAFNNVWHNELRYKIFMLDLLSKMTRSLSDFLVG